MESRIRYQLNNHYAQEHQALEQEVFRLQSQTELQDTDYRDAQPALFRSIGLILRLDSSGKEVG